MKKLFYNFLVTALSASVAPQHGPASLRGNRYDKNSSTGWEPKIVPTSILFIRPLHFPTMFELSEEGPNCAKPYQNHFQIEFRVHFRREHGTLYMD